MSIICLLVTAVIITAISIVSIFCEVVRLAAKQKRQFDGFTFRELRSLAKYDKKVAVGVEVTLRLRTNQNSRGKYDSERRYNCQDKGGIGLRQSLLQTVNMMESAVTSDAIVNL